MFLKFDFYCLRTNKEPFLSLRTSRTLSLGEFDESKTHLFLFQVYFRLKSLIECKIMEFSPRFMFCRNLKKISRKSTKTEKKNGSKGSNVMTSYAECHASYSNVTTSSRHRLK